LLTQGCRWRSNPGLKLANAFGVFTNWTTTTLDHYPIRATKSTKRLRSRSVLSVPFCGYATLFFAELERVDSASNFSSVVHVPKINAEVTKTPLCHPHFPTSI